MIDDAFLNYREVLQPDPILNMENDETEELFSEHSNEENSDDDSAIPSKCPSAVIPSVVKDEEISKRVQSLNTQQREVFELVHSAAKRHLKNLNCMKPRKLTCLNLFLTGFAGTGKSFVVRLLFDHLTKLFSFKNPAREKVILLAPTGIAAINIGGTTFYSALAIPPKVNGKLLTQLSSNKPDELRHRFSELQAVIIDEVRPHLITCMFPISGLSDLSFTEKNKL